MEIYHCMVLKEKNDSINIFKWKVKDQSAKDQEIFQYLVLAMAS